MSDPTLNEVLASLGLRTRPSQHRPGMYRKEVLDSTGAVLFDGAAHEVWGWLRSTGRIQ